MELHDGKATNVCERFQRLCDVHDAATISVVLDDGQNRNPRPLVDRGRIRSQMFRMDLDPWIERGMLRTRPCSGLEVKSERGKGCTALEERAS